MKLQRVNVSLKDNDILTAFQFYFLVETCYMWF